MDENIGTATYNAEITALNSEICRLKKYINDSEKERAEASKIDPHDPFANPTEYHNYSDDYSAIQPMINVPEFKMPHNVPAIEYKNLRGFYSVGGWCSLLRLFASIVLSRVMIRGIAYGLRAVNPDIDGSAIYDYVSSTSILSGLNLLVFAITNVAFAFIGLKLSKTKFTSLIKTEDFGLSDLVKYCIIGFALWFISVYSGVFVSIFTSKMGLKIDSGGDLSTVTGVGIAVSGIYTCVIAPVTEELFYRGMLLKVFSKANQRFAVFATALMFGLGHGNIRQCILGFVLGLFFAHITYKHNSIIPSITIHAFLNTMTFVISMLELNNNEQLMLMEGELLAAVIGVVILMVFRGRDKIPATTPAQIQRGSVIARGSLGMILTFGAHFAVLIYNIYSINHT